MMDRTRRANLALGSAAFLLGLVLAGGTLLIDSGFGYDRIGPRTAPYGVALGLLLIGGALVMPALRRSREDDAPVSDPLRWQALGILALACAVFLLLAGRVGFILAASLQFWLVARAFGNRRPLRDAGAALLLAIVVYAAFAHGLGLALPAGPLEALLPF
ncbi:MAG: tripartite tricarboxylate transporter TctB family protein [Acidobacteria bacterium]|nr:tripartite tricarboxylate transporter TctB family protein [Acidobacteriota bacterium]